MRIIATLVLLCCLCAQAFVLDSTCALVSVDSPSQAEQTALAELGACLEKSLGLHLPVYKELLPAGKKGIYVGWTAETLRRLAPLRQADLRKEEIILKSFPDGTIVLAGEGPRGTLYAAYTFLEESLGVRWPSPGVEYIPNLQTGIDFSEIDLRYAPAIEIRSPGGAYFGPGDAREPAFCAHHKVNGSYNISSKYGASVRMPGEIRRDHTMSVLLPYEGESKDPELFAWRDGRRITGAEGQPCLTNPRVKELILQKSIAMLSAKNNRQPIFPVTQNDNTNYCRCPECRAMADKLGGQSDLLLWFINQLADEIGKQFPDVLIETFAYNYTLEPPKTVKPAGNVKICLCLIEADSRLPLTHENNRYFRDICMGWSKVTSNLAIWHYITNFTNFGLIHPNFQAIGENIRFFEELGVKDIYSQDSSDAGKFGFFPELREYINAKLLWDPSVDQAAITQDFLRCCYGAAADKVGEYLHLNETELAAAQGHNLDCYEFGTNRWLSQAALLKGGELLDDAAALAESDEIRERVKNLRVSHDWTVLWRLENSPLRALTGMNSPFEAEGLRAGIEARLNAIPFSPGYKNMYLGEGSRVKQGIANLDRFLGEPFPITNVPAGLRGKKRLLPLESSFFSPSNCEIVDDYLSPCKKSMRLYLKGHEWAVRVTLPAAAGAAPAKVYAELRLPQKVTAAEGIAAVGGIYVYGTNFMDITALPVSSDTLSNQAYSLVSLGEADLQRDLQVYLRGAGNPTVPELLLARLWLVWE